MNRIDRLLALILYLQSRRTCTAEAMAEHRSGKTQELDPETL